MRAFTRTRLATRAGIAALLLCAALAEPRVAAAQSDGTLSGRVVDAASGDPVTDALITLEPARPGVIIDIAVAAGVTPVRTVVTGASGAYRFTGVAVGSYRLRIERIGYRAVSLDVDVRRAGDAGLSIGMELEPVLLRPVRVEQRAASLFQRASNARGEPDDARLSAEWQRQERFLSSDTRVLTYADVMDGVTLGGGDVFRALQRFAGVATRDDYTAELWLRGAPWTQTRVTLDGVPLFNPVHAVGVLSAIAPEVLGSVHLHPGVRPASIGEGAAGVVDMRTRSGMGDGELRGVADVSTASAKLVLDQRIGDRAAWLIGGRRSHLDVLTGGLDFMGLDTVDLPYVFHDLAGRIDVGAGPVQFEASGLWEQDRLEGDVDGVLERVRARWGNTAATITMRAPAGSRQLSQTVGLSRFDSRTVERTIRTRETVPAWTEPASHNAIDYVRVAGAVTPAGSDHDTRWSAGYEVAWQRVDYDGSFPRYYAVQPDTSMRITYRRALVVGAVWSTARVPIGARLLLDLGARLETSDRMANAGPLRLSPRVTLRASLADAQTVSLSLGRTWQHTQSIGLAGPSIHPAFHAAHFWLWSDETTPALRADIVNIGSERWLGRGWLASANAFMRVTDGYAMPDPTPGRLGRRPLLVRASGSASGVELGVRRIGAAWSGSLGYSYGVSEVETGGAAYPSPADRRHVLDAMAGLRVWRGFRAAAAYTSMTGAPFTRAYSRSPEHCTSFGFGCEDPTGSYIDEYNAERTPAYRSLDVSLEWAQTAGPVQVSAYVQVRNVLGRDNASTYAGSGPAGEETTRNGTRTLWDDRFESGLPRMPMVGLRMTF